MTKGRDQKQICIYRTSVSIALLFIITVGILYIGLPFFSGESYVRNTDVAGVAGAILHEPEVFVRKATHVSTPEAVKGIYMTSCVAGTPSLRNNLVKLIDETEINSVVLDIKSYDGHISFMPESDVLKPAAGGGCFVRDMQDFIDELHSKNIYVIVRLAVFQDVFMVKQKPEWAVKRASATSTAWTDRKGISWIDAGAKPYWDYIVTLAREAYSIGADEINFDYIRFPSDGDMRDVYYPWSGNRLKRDVMREFFAYLHNELSPEGIVISADLFGMTTTNLDDLNIGQVLEDALPYFDYIAPMVYPSHYPKGFFGLGDPNESVYEVVKISMDHAVRRTVATTTSVALPDARIGTSTPALYAKPSFDRNKLRPWLQDNNYPVPYTAEMVRAQIQASYDAGLNSWLLWNAGNRYTRAALE